MFEKSYDGQRGLRKSKQAKYAVQSNIFIFLKKVKIALPDEPVILFLDIYPKEWKTGSQIFVPSVLWAELWASPQPPLYL